MSGTAIVASRCPDLGAACAARLGQQVDSVGVLAHGFDPDERVAAAGVHAAARVDDLDQVGTALDGLVPADGPGVDVVVAVLGPGRPHSVLRGGTEVFDQHLAEGLGFVYRAAAWGARAMVPRRGGRIVLVSSVIGLYGGAWETAGGAASAGVLGLSRSLAREVAGVGVTVNVVTVGAVHTAHLAEVGATAAGARHLREMEERSALGRLGQPHEVAEVVGWLASPGASYVTGAIVPVDGGLAMGFA